MAVHVRLMRMGAKKRPFYRIVAIDSRRPRESAYLDNLGWYNPIETPAKVNVQEDKIIQWLDRGAEPSDTVRTLLTHVGFWEKLEKAKRGEDVSEIELRTEIRERKKRTRKIKKAAIAAAEAKEKEAEEKAKAAEAEAKAEEAPAEEAPAEETKEEGGE